MLVQIYNIMITKTDVEICKTLTKGFNDKYMKVESFRIKIISRSLTSEQKCRSEILNYAYHNIGSAQALNPQSGSERA